MEVLAKETQEASGSSKAKEQQQEFQVRPLVPEISKEVAKVEKQQG